MGAGNFTLIVTVCTPNQGALFPAHSNGFYAKYQEVLCVIVLHSVFLFMMTDWTQKNTLSWLLLSLSYV